MIFIILGEDFFGFYHFYSNVREYVIAKKV